jgi:hypothetical protein
MAATTLAVAGAVTAAGSSVASFVQAGKQHRLQAQAELDAQKAMAEARKKLDVNFYDQLAINKEPYELQREALISQGAQAINAAAESERGVAATAGRVQMAQNEAQGGIRTAMGNEMQNLERLSATEDSRLRDVNVQLDLDTVAGAQRAARDAQGAAARATTQGINSASDAFMKSAALIPLYFGNNNKNEDNIFKPVMNPYNAAGAQMNGVGYNNLNKPVMDNGGTSQFVSTQPNYDPFTDPMNPFGAYANTAYPTAQNPIQPQQWQPPFDPYGFKPY